jgi:hypothetical protein
MIRNVLPIIFSSSEIMFMGHLGKRISSQSIIDKVYIFNNRIRTSEKLYNCTINPLHLDFILIRNYPPSDFMHFGKNADLEIGSEQKAHVQADTGSFQSYKSLWLLGCVCETGLANYIFSLK